MIYLLTGIKLTHGGGSTVQRQYTEQQNKTKYTEHDITNN